MSEKEQIVAEATAKAQAEAKKQNLNKAQTKLFVDEAVKKALDSGGSIDDVIESISMEMANRITPKSR